MAISLQLVVPCYSSPRTQHTLKPCGHRVRKGLGSLRDAPMDSGQERERDAVLCVHHLGQVSKAAQTWCGDNLVPDSSEHHGSPSADPLPCAWHCPSPRHKGDSRFVDPTWASSFQDHPQRDLHHHMNSTTKCAGSQGDGVRGVLELARTPSQGWNFNSATLQCNHSPDGLCFGIHAPRLEGGLSGGGNKCGYDGRARGGRGEETGGWVCATSCGVSLCGGRGGHMGPGGGASCLSDHVLSPGAVRGVGLVCPNGTRPGGWHPETYSPF